MRASSGRLQAVLGGALALAALVVGVLFRFTPASAGLAHGGAGGLALAAGACLLAAAGAVVARPRRDAWVLCAWLFLAVGLGPALVFLAGLEASARSRLLVSGVELSAGGALLIALVRWERSRILRGVKRTRLNPKKKLPVEGRGQVPVEALQPGDRLAIPVGEDIPVDARVVSGGGFVDEALLSGSALPATKKAGDLVLAGSSSTVPELVVEAIRPAAESLLELREHRVAKVADELLHAGAAERLWAGSALGLSLLLATLPPLALGTAELERWLPATLAFLLVLPSGAPVLALFAAKLAALGRARGGGLVLSRPRDVGALMRAGRVQVDAGLLAAPAGAAVLPFGVEEPGPLVVAAHALLEESPGAEREALAAELSRRGLPPARAAALKRPAALIQGTVEGARWFLGTEEAVREELGVELPLSARGPLGYLREKHELTWLVGQEGQGVLGAIGLEFRVDSELAAAAARLGATVLPGPPDRVRRLAASRAGLTCDGPPLGKRDLSLLPERAEPPSSGLRLRLLDPAGSLELASDASPRLLPAAVPRLPQLLAGLAALRRRSLLTAGLALLVPAVIGSAFLLLDTLTPAAAALLGGATLVLASRAAVPPR